MGLAASQARLNMLTLRKADLQYRLSMLSEQNVNLSVKQAEAIEKKAKALTNCTADEKANFKYSAAYAEYETAMVELNAAQNRLDSQIKLIETQNKAVSQEEEEIKKLIEKNAKSFGVFSK